VPKRKQIERLKNAFATGDRAWADAESRTAPGDLACRAGCFGCCVGLFEISLPEAALVRTGFERLAAEAREDARKRAQRLVAETASSFPGDAGSGLLDPERTEEADDAYFEVVADRACPMLELPSGRCRIYEERPMTCRTYGFAWAKEGAVIHPSCGLNLPGADPDRQLASAIHLDQLDNAEDVDLELASGLGLAAGRETTVAHAIVGTLFAPPERGSALP
jgi:Fe-S-cluster containining protein